MDLLTYSGFFLLGFLVAYLILRRRYKRKIENMIPLNAAKNGACLGIEQEFERLKRR